MILNKNYVEETDLWKAKGYDLPAYDRGAVIERTKERPEWVHFGAGNIFRSFPALLAEELLNKGESNTGITVVEGFDYEIIDKVYDPHDDLSILVTLGADMKCEKRVLGSVALSLKMGRQFPDQIEKLKQIFRSDFLRMVSFTITEKGYKLKDSEGEYFEEVKEDLEAGPENAKTYAGMIASLVYERYLAGGKPLALVSMDNFSHNGEKLEGVIMSFADAWSLNKLSDPGFAEYVKNRSVVSFPWSMIDKITPRPDKTIEAMLRKDGIEGGEIIVTDKSTYISSFVNAEKPQYLVIEDDFPNGRPPLEKTGVFMTDRETVDKTERMKVCTCLNPLHTALAIFGCLFGYVKVSDEMSNPMIKKLVYDIGYKEGLPVAIDPGIISPEKFIREVLEERIPNPFLPDTPQRIATDTSQKLPIRFGETIRAYMKDPGKDPGNLKLIPLVLAGWLRYLMGIDDKGEPFNISPDPMSGTLTERMAVLELGERSREKVESVLRPILMNQEIFGADLEKADIYDRIINMYMEMIQGKGYVLKTLEKYVSER